MTTFQDPPPHSRRAVRQSERGETVPATPAEGTPYSFDAAARSVSSAPVAHPNPQAAIVPQVVSQPAAVPENSAANAQAAQPLAPAVLPSGRRAQLPATSVSSDSSDSEHRDGQQLPGFEPLTYSTQGRIAQPDDEQAHQNHSATSDRAESLAFGDSAFRVRDFSPEGRRSAAPRQPLDTPLTTSSSYPGPGQTSGQAHSAAHVQGPALTQPVDLDYHTQASPPPQAAGPARTAGPAQAAGPAQTAVPPQSHAHVASPLPPTFSSSSSSLSPSPLSPSTSPSVSPYVSSSGSLDENQGHTMTRRELRELRAAAEQQVPALQLPEPIDTLLNSGPIDIPTLAPPPGQSQALAEAMAEFDMLTRARREADARARDAQVASLATPIVLPPKQASPQVAEPVLPMPVAADPVGSVPVAAAPVAAAPVASAPVAAAPVDSAPVASVPSAVSVSSPPAPARVAPPHLIFPLVDVVPTEPVQAAPEAYGQPPAAQPPAAQSTAAQSTAAQYPADQPPVPERPVAERPIAQPLSFDQSPILAPPVFPASAGTNSVDQDEHGGRSPRASNHWRVQAAMEDDDLPYENTISRTVGLNTSAITTSALVLPSVPQPDGLLASLTSTGEILVTGSIALPRSLGSTGAHPHRVDHADDEDDPLDSQVAAPDSAPVRAIRAVSTTTSTRAVIETKRPQGNRLLTGVIIAASVLCVGLVGLLVFAFATGKL